MMEGVCCFESSFVPDVVQCQNKGWDGVDVQWECKTDMDNAYRFGRIEVSCEGFNHPDDPYILKGSCGLEYALELTEEGRQRRRGGGGGGGGFGDFAGFASSFFQGSSDSRRSHQGEKTYHQSSTGGDGGGDASGLIVVALFLLLAYGVYKMFLCGPVARHQRFGDGGPQGPNTQGFPHNAGPPPPGFKPDYTDHSSGYGGSAGYPGGSAGYPGASSGNPGASSGYPGASSGYPGASSGYGFRNDFMGSQSTQNHSSTGNGFWTGMGSGGILGYLFGSQRRQSGNSYRPTGNSGYSWNSGTPKTPPASTGTRTASGFGGTKRR
ncbi:hypothetical protein COCON_G00119730 [Conger conger]|uniref:Store-operated calcium entry-associated regulatory factor n=1 Tax=Conger conger TaxID=82655 RepID=A0A9Q1HYI5_CONCO|nr:hypothetical protein COCON_G00119730 [Conger conger]